MSNHGKIKIYIVVNRLSKDRVNPDHALISLTDDDLKDPEMVRDQNDVLVRAEEMQWIPIRPVLSGFAISGTTLFLFGGTMREYVLMPVDDMHFIDMEGSGGPLWKKGPSMKAKRWLSKAVSLDGKVYVFGRTEGCDPWAEVYDIESQNWSDLKTPGDIDSHATADPCCLLDTEISGHCVKKILVYDDVRSRLCGYDLILGQWDEECNYNELQITTGVTQLLSSGKMLFVVSETEWSVFDVESMTHRCEVSGLDGLLDELRRDDLQLHKIVSLGCRNGIHEFLVIFCVQNGYFVEKIEVVDDGKDLNATLQSLGGFRLEEDVYVAHLYAVKTSADMSSSENGKSRRGDKNDEPKILKKEGDTDDGPHKILHENEDGDGETVSLLPTDDADSSGSKEKKGSTETGYQVVSSGVKMLVSGAQSLYHSLSDSEGNPKAEWIKENVGVITVGAVTTMTANMVVGYFLVNKLLNK